MIELFAATGILIVAAITPGPNNVFVMTAAIQGGVLHAFRTMSAIIVGSLILLVLVRLGLDSVSQHVPLFTSTVTLFGSIYLGWMGCVLIKPRLKPAKSLVSGPHKSYLGLSLFQLLNPKGWVLVSVFLAASEQAQLTVLVTILIVVTFGCLSVWALAGLALSRLYETSRGRLWIDRLMGTALIIFSVLLAMQSVFHS
ncbi:MAG: LysE family translocator [Parasphingorhabdus sp.]